VTKVIFWDVDTQVDFMVPEGKLYVPGAVEITKSLLSLSRYAREMGITRVASVCDHVLGDSEISDEPDFRTTFPPHCLRGTEGQQKIPVTSLISPLVIPNRRFKVPGEMAGEILVEKNQFDVFTNPNTHALLDGLAPEAIIVYGVAQDVCVAHAIAGFLERGGSGIIFVEDASRPIDAERGKSLLGEWRRQGVIITHATEVLSGVVP